MHGRPLLLVALGTAIVTAGCRTVGFVVDSEPRMVAVPGTSSTGSPVLYVLDTRRERLAVYSTSGKNIELIAARNIEYDLKLDSYHDGSADEVQVRRLREDWQKTRGGGAAPERGDDGK